MTSAHTSQAAAGEPSDPTGQSNETAGKVGDEATAQTTTTSTTTSQTTTQQSSTKTNTAASAPPDLEASASTHKSPTSLPSPTQSTPFTSTTSTDPSQTENFNVRVDTSTTVTISGLGVTRNMSPPNRTGRPAVRFADWTDVQNNDGTTFQQPVNSASSPTTFAFTAGDTQQQQVPSEPEPAAAAPPPSGPPPNPPTTPAAAAPEPEPQPPRACDCGTSGANDQASATEPIPDTSAAFEAHSGNQQQTYYPRVVSNIVPPIGPHATAAMGNQQHRPIYILSSAPAQAPQNAAFVSTNANQPYLWVNPPLVAPSVPPPPPGNTGSWCYPSQSPFWAGASVNQTNPPPQFYVAEQGYVAQPTYIATTTQQAPQQMPHVQYYVNGTTGPIVYYTQ